MIEYTIDSDYDLFQIGRSPRPGVDISVADFDTKSHSGASEISRFACRILADRSDPTKVELFAAGFDDSLQIFLGINAHKWYNSSGDPDGFTTNGVRILHPDSSSWAQLSVEGHLYPLNIG